MSETRVGPVSKEAIRSLFLGIIFAVTGLTMVIGGIVWDKALRPSPFADSKWYIYLLEIGGALVFLASGFNFHYYISEKLSLKRMNVKQMGVIAIFSALSVILYYFAKFNLPFFPSWLDIQFSDVPALLTSFMYGPWSGVLVIVVRFFCKLPGTMTVGVGEFADLIIGATLCLVCGYIYKKHRSLKGAFAAMGIGMLSATFVATIANWVILIPAYVNITGFTIESLADMMNKYMGGVVTVDNFMAYYLFVGVIPFNLFRYGLVFLITVLLYKRLSMAIEHFTGDFAKDEEEVENSEENKEKEENSQISNTGNA